MRPTERLNIHSDVIVVVVVVVVYFFFFYLSASSNQCQDRALSRALSQCGGRPPGGNSSR